MIVRDFLDWFSSAPVLERIEAVRLMTRAYFTGGIGGDTPEDVVAALTLVLDDPARAVRAALSWELASEINAPRHLVLGLAHDRSEVASPILARSPLLTDADLIDCLSVGEPLRHLAIAMRENLSADVAHALAGVATSRAIIALLANPGADVGAKTLRRIAHRLGDVAAIRDVLSQRPDVPVDVRQALVASVSDSLLAFVTQAGWMEDARGARVVGDVRSALTVELAGEAQDLHAYVAHLGASKQLTPDLLLRSLMTGDAGLFGAALALLAGQKPERIAGIIRSGANGAFVAAYGRARLPANLLPAFAAGVEAIRDLRGENAVVSAGVNRAVVQRMLGACLQVETAELRPVIALLRRLDAAAAREEARRTRERFRHAAAPVTVDHLPKLLLEYAAAPQVMVPECDMPVAPAMVEDHAATEAAPTQELQPPALAPAAEPRRTRIPAPTAAAAPGRIAALSDDLEELFARTFRKPGPQPAPVSEPALRVSDSELDGAFFANWDLRRDAA